MKYVYTDKIQLFDLNSGNFGVTIKDCYKYKTTFFFVATKCKANKSGRDSCG